MAGSERIARPSMLDRVLARFAPGYALRRKLSGAKLRALTEAQNYYDASKRNARTQFWRRHVSDPNASLFGQAGNLRNVARDSVRNNPYGARIPQAIATNVVGSGIKPHVTARTKRAEKRLKDLATRHLGSTDIDADGRHDITGLQNLVMRAVVESGECLIRRRRRRSSDGYAVPFQIQVLEADHIDTEKNGELANGHTVVQGIEFDKVGQRVAYWLFSIHPGALEGAGIPTSKRVNAADIAHVYRVDRPGQVRGVTWLAPVLVRLNDFMDYLDAQLVRQKISACFTAFVTGDDEDEPADDADMSSQGYRVEGLEPGTIEYLRSGESVDFSDPPKVDGFDQYAASTLREIATGVGMPYMVLTGDLAGANYSVGRLGWLEFQRNITVWTNHMLIPAMLTPIGRWFMEAAALVEGVSAADAKIEWRAPRREMINPKEEIAAAKDLVRAGFSSRSREALRFGVDPEDLEAEIAQENERADALGLKFDSDPRQMSSQGQEQPSAANDNAASDDDAGETESKTDV